MCAEYILLYLRFAIVNAGVAMAGITIKVRHAHARARHSREFWGRGRGILGSYLGLGGARQVDGTGLANRGWSKQARPEGKYGWKRWAHGLPAKVG